MKVLEKKQDTSHSTLVIQVLHTRGDALGVMAQNPPHIVDELIEVQGWDADEMVITHNGEKRLWDALKCDFEVHMANKKFVASLAEKVVSGQIRIKSTIMRRVRMSRN